MDQARSVRIKSFKLSVNEIVYNKLILWEIKQKYITRIVFKMKLQHSNKN